MLWFVSVLEHPQHFCSVQFSGNIPVILDIWALDIAILFGHCKEVRELALVYEIFFWLFHSSSLIVLIYDTIIKNINTINSITLHIMLNDSVFIIIIQIRETANIICKL